MAKKKSKKKSGNTITIEYPIYKFKHGLKLFYRGENVIALKVFPMDFETAAKYMDTIINGEFSMKKAFKDILPNLKEYVEVDESSDVKLDVNQLMINDPEKNPLEFSELLDLIMEILKVSGVLERNMNLEDTLLKQEVIGTAKVVIKPLGMMECAEALDILSAPDRTQKLIDAFVESLIDYIDIETDVDIDSDAVCSTDPMENPFTFTQINDIIKNLLVVSKVIPGDVEKFHGEDKKVRRNRRGKKHMGDSSKD